MAPSIAVENVTVAYNGNIVLDDLSFEYDGPGIIQVLGPNGAGKTTLLKTIMGLIKPLKGRIIINGEDVTGKPSRAGRYMGYTPQLILLGESHYPITLRELVECCLVMRRRWPRIIVSREEKRRAEETLELVGLPRDVWDRDFGKLSGGQRQRGFIARALVFNPGILVMDEPFSSVDPRGRAELAGLIGRLSEDRLVIVTSHDPMLLLKFTDRILLVNRTRYYYGSPEAVLNREILSKIYGMGIVAAEKHIHIFDSHI